MGQTIPLDALGNFEALPIFREIISRGDTGLSVSGFDLGLDDKAVNGLKCHGVVPIEELKTEAGAQSPLRGFSEKLHRLASLVLNNISHAIELPWEKYLSEMHEYDAPSRSEIKIVNNVHDVGSAWSTLTVLVSLKTPQTAAVLFGEALSVFTDGSIPNSFLKELGAIGPTLTPDGHGIVVYSVCPNEDVLYIRVAGALMRPLSSRELSTAQRVKDLDNRKIRL